MNMVHRFAHPEYFDFIALVPLIFALHFIFEIRHRKKIGKSVSAQMYEYLTSSLSSHKRRLKLFIECAVIVLWSIALARPQAGRSEQNVKSEGVEIMILFDVSQSMLAEDVKPSRLALAKKELSRFLDVSGDKVGLVAFAGSSVLLSPLTNDKDALKMYIESLNTESVSTQGTDFRSALNEAMDAFDRGSSADADSNAVTRAIVMVSDGEDNEKGADEVLKKIVDKNIKVFTLVVGTEKGAPIPVHDQEGNLRSYRKDKSDKVVVSTSNGKALMAIAKTGGGGFYQLTATGSATNQLEGDLSKLQKSQFDNAVVLNYDEKFQWFLFPALLLALTELFLGERSASGRIWRGRFEVAET